MKCLRTILGLNIGDTVPNRAILDLSGQPKIEEIIRRNRLRWFGHMNRMEDYQNKSSLVKQTMYSHFPKEKRPRNIGVRKRWEVKVTEDMSVYNITSWRREVNDRDEWRETINRRVKTTAVNSNIKQIIQQYKKKQRTERGLENKPLWEKHHEESSKFW